MNSVAVGSDPVTLEERGYRVYPALLNIKYEFVNCSWTLSVFIVINNVAQINQKFLMHYTNALLFGEQ